MDTLVPMGHEVFMHRCLELAEEGRGRVGNGALVGAVLVREGKILAEGFHEAFGAPHAERVLLDRHPEKIQPDDILYINLEPCCHHGKTPPCTKFLVDRGLKNVAIGMLDPDPRVSGKGIDELRSANVAVMGPILRAECECFNRGFITLRTKGRPWITLKRAQDRSGTFANRDGSPKKITSREQDDFSHGLLRATQDAIIVGVETIIRDDPQLTTRIPNKKCIQPWRIILDPSLRIPKIARVLTDEHRTRTIIITREESAPSSLASTISIHGPRVFPVSQEGSGFSWKNLWSVLTEPSNDFHGITSILVEGGTRTWDTFRTAGMVDEDVILIGA